MKYSAVLMDIDDTLFDFRRSSFEALRTVFRCLGIDFTWQMMSEYEVFNLRMWQSYERGEIKKDDIYVTRFRDYFASAGIDADPVWTNRRYLDALACGRAFMPHAEELLQALHGKYKIFVVTNGDTFAQEKRIASSGFAPYFDGVFISEQLGSKKPEKEFYDKVFAIVGEEYRSSTLMVGDSLTSDMQGGRNAGVDTCYYCLKVPPDDRCDYVIHDLLELIPILEQE